jgi:hypothetical protein
MRKAIAIVGLALAASPAMAGEGIFCGGPSEEIHIELPLGGGAGLNVLDATIKVGDQVWSIGSTVPGATPIIAAQAFSLNDRFYFDFADDNYEGIVASVRLFRAGEPDIAAFGGTLEVRGVGAWPIACGMG